MTAGFLDNGEALAGRGVRGKGRARVAVALAAGQERQGEAAGEKAFYGNNILSPSSR